MLDNCEASITEVDEFKRRNTPETVSVDSLRFLPVLVRQPGGDPGVILRRAQNDPALLGRSGAIIEYHSLLHAMQFAADALSSPDFGLRLAVMQGTNRTIGTIGVVVENSKTLGQAIGYFAKNIHACSVAMRVRFEPDRSNHKLLVKLEVLLVRVSDKRQAVEHAVMLASLHVRELTGGGARVRRVMFAHEPMSPMRVYRQYFNCDVSFCEKADGLILAEDDLLCPVVDSHMRIYEMARIYIESRFSHVEASIQSRVRSLIEQYNRQQGLHQRAHCRRVLPASAHPATPPSRGGDLVRGHQ